jgi:hypothetical protein
MLRRVQKELLDDAAQQCRSVGAGSARPDPAASAAYFDRASLIKQDAMATIDRAIALAEKMIAKLISPMSSLPAPPNEPAGRPVWGIDAVNLAAIRAGLPAPITPSERPRRKTHGRWIDVTGTTRSIISGEDVDSARVLNTPESRNTPRLSSTTYRAVGADHAANCFQSCCRKDAR